MQSVLPRLLWYPAGHAVQFLAVLHPKYTDIVELSFKSSGKHSCLVLLDENPSVERPLGE